MSAASDLRIRELAEAIGMDQGQQDDRITTVEQAASDADAKATDAQRALSAPYQPFANRAAAEAANIPNPVDRISYLDPNAGTLSFVRDPSGTALITGGGDTWSPDGDAYADHWGASRDASPLVNHAAIQAALNSNYRTIKFFTGGKYTVGGPLRYTGVNKTLEGATSERAALEFTDDFDGPCLAFEPVDLSGSGFRSGNGISNINLLGGGSERFGRWAFNIERQASFIFRNVRWEGFSFGLKVLGGQFNFFSNFNSSGSGLPANTALTGSCQLLIGNSGTQKNYNQFFNQFTLGSGRNHETIINLQKTDGHYFTNGYISNSINSHIYIDNADGEAVIACFFTNCYFDGQAGSTIGSGDGTLHFISSVDNSSAGSVSLNFTSGQIANFDDTIFDLDVANNIRNLRFSNLGINRGIGIGKIRGASGANGLNFQLSNVTFSEFTDGIEVNGATIADLDAVFRSVTDATGVVKLTGTVSQKKLSLAFSDTGSRLVDTSTGEIRRTTYDHQQFRLDNFIGQDNIERGLYHGSSSSSFYGGPDVEGWSFYCSVEIDQLSDRHYYLYRRASATSPRAWFGYRNGPTGAVTWTPIVLTSDTLSSISVTPRFVGQTSVVGGNAYMAVGTSSSADWKQIT